MQDNNQKYMKLAMQLALHARGQTSPNPMVGAVIVKANRIMATGFHPRAGGDHAEIVALKKAGARARGAKLYVTLEPCYHYGRTAPCVDAVIKSGVREVIIGMRDPNPLTNGKSVAKLRKAGVRVAVGVLEKELKQMNEPFIKFITQKIPFTVAKCAQTIDGKIATATGDSKWITCEESRHSARRLRDDFDAILVGVNTVLKDNPRLNGASKQKSLKKIILDPSLKISLKANLFKKVCLSDCVVAVTSKAPKGKIHIFQNLGIHVIVCPARQRLINLKWLFKELAKHEIISILIEGGAHTIGSALKSGLVDKMHIYIAPKILGDKRALSSVVGFNIIKMDQTIVLKDVSVEKIRDDIFIQAYVHGNH